MRRWPPHSTPHSLFVLDKKTAPAGACRRPTAARAAALRPETNGPYPQGVRRIRKRQSRQRLRSGRSKRKKRCGGSVRAGAYLRPPAGEGWPCLAAALMKRDALGESMGPGRARIPRPPLSAGAALAVNAGRRGRRPLQGVAGNPVNGRPIYHPVGADAHIRPPCQASINC